MDSLKLACDHLTIGERIGGYAREVEENEIKRDFSSIHPLCLARLPPRPPPPPPPPPTHNPRSIPLSEKLDVGHFWDLKGTEEVAIIRKLLTPKRYDDRPLPSFFKVPEIACTLFKLAATKYGRLLPSGPYCVKNVAF